MEYCHLHVHSEKSWFDGIIKVPNLIKKAISQGIPSVALTDHNHVMGWFELEKYTEGTPLNSVFGIELNVRQYHITALAMNEKGLQNIIKLNNLAHIKNRVQVEESEIIKYKEGIYFLTGCTKGRMHKEYYEKGVRGMYRVIEEYQQFFDKNFGIETTNPNIPSDMKKAFAYLEKRGSLIVPTNDCHFLEKEDGIVYHQNMWLKTHGKINSDNYQQRYYKTPQEMEQEYPKEWLENTVTIANRCSASYKEYCLENIKNELIIPVCEIERYTDEECMKMVFVNKKDYKNANRILGIMKKESLQLEDLLKIEEFHAEAIMAFGLRGTIKKVKESNSHLVVIDLEKHPIFKNRKSGKIFSQWTKEEAIALKMKVSNI